MQKESDDQSHPEYVLVSIRVDRSITIRAAKGLKEKSAVKLMEVEL